MKNIISIFLVIFLLFIYNGAYAAPDKVSNKLLNDEISVMDFGCYKLQLKLQKAIDKALVEDKDLYGYGRCTYDWELDKIVFNVSIFLKKGIESISKQDLKKVVGAIDYMINGRFTKIFYMLEFQHNGYTNSTYKLNDEESTVLKEKFLFYYSFDNNIKIAEANPKLLFFDFKGTKINP